MYYLEYKIFNLYFPFLLSYIYIWLSEFLYITLFNISTLTLYNILNESENFPCRIFTISYNKNNQHYRHSDNSPPLLFYQLTFSYIICSNSEHFHQFPIWHDTEQFTVMNFSECDGKYSWQINVRDIYWNVSVDWSHNIPLCKYYFL
jgi:hypothetical protein